MELYIIGKYKALIVKIAGELDHHAAAGMREAIDRELQRTGAINLVFDFSRVRFMDSSGIGMIIGRYKIVKSLGGKVVIAGASENTERIIKMSGVTDLLIIAETVEAGLEEVAQND
jgi:stage II sporulation protein AA (anti-sigma F factor antagonist)